MSKSNTAFKIGDEVLYSEKGQGQIISVNNDDGDIGYDVKLKNGTLIHHTDKNYLKGMYEPKMYES